MDNNRIIIVYIVCCRDVITRGCYHGREVGRGVGAQLMREFRTCTVLRRRQRRRPKFSRAGTRSPPVTGQHHSAFGTCSSGGVHCRYIGTSVLPSSYTEDNVSVARSCVSPATYPRGCTSENTILLRPEPLASPIHRILACSRQSSLGGVRRDPGRSLSVDGYSSLTAIDHVLGTATAPPGCSMPAERL